MPRINTNYVGKLAMLASLFYLSPVNALIFTADKSVDIIGKVQTVITQKNDNLHSLARKYDLGYDELLQANPQLNPNKKLVAGTKLTIPTEFILPNSNRDGIVVNLAELRVYYFAPDQRTIATYPLAIGREGWRTPLGETTIVRKRENPTWTPPDNIREAEEEEGIDLPDVIPAGPNNPLGLYAMNLGWDGILMHGTNVPDSIGQRSSHGCMRMYPEDIKDLFGRTSVGTKVQVVYQPFKVGTKNGELYLEAHKLFKEDFYSSTYEDTFKTLQDLVNSTNYAHGSQINWTEARELAEAHYGYPVKITGSIPNLPGLQTDAARNQKAAVKEAAAAAAARQEARDDDENDDDDKTT